MLTVAHFHFGLTGRTICKVSDEICKLLVSKLNCFECLFQMKIVH